jgi:hypothetical protein
VRRSASRRRRVQSRLFRENRGDGLGRPLADEGSTARQHLVQQASKRQTSARLSTSLPAACSGAMYAEVPRMTPRPVIAGDVIVGDCGGSGAGLRLGRVGVRPRAVVSERVEQDLDRLPAVREWCPWPATPRPCRGPDAVGQFVRPKRTPRERAIVPRRFYSIGARSGASIGSRRIGPVPSATPV